MATKKGSTDMATPMTTVAADLAHKLLTFLEVNGKTQDTKNGPWQSTTERAYFGLKLNQPVMVGERRTTIEAMWTAKMRTLVQSGALSMPLDLGWSLQQAQQQRKVFGYMTVGKQDHNKGKKLGMKYWTVENPKAAESRGEVRATNQPEW